jgi:REP element-mobilizing transposase RayT
MAKLLECVRCCAALDSSVPAILTLSANSTKSAAAAAHSKSWRSYAAEGRIKGMGEGRVPWPRAPTHRLAQSGTYIVTAGTYLKAHYFRDRQRLDVLQRGLLTVAQDFGWRLEAWAVFSNHYHFVGHSPDNAAGAESLSQMLGALHTKTAQWLNKMDQQLNRQIWHNFWETRLTHDRSYRARLN